MIWDDQYNQYLAALEKARSELSEQDRKSNDSFGWSFWGEEEFTFGYMYDWLNAQPETIPDFSVASDEVIQWFINALKDEQRKWFALCVLALAKKSYLNTPNTDMTSALPDIFFPALVRAGIYETNPSLNKYFIGNACDYGCCRVAEKLYEYAEHGNDFERDFALGAFYWVVEPLDPTSAECSELVDFFKTVAADARHSDFVREHANGYYGYLADRALRQKASGTNAA